MVMMILKLREEKYYWNNENQNITKINNKKNCINAQDYCN